MLSVSDQQIFGRWSSLTPPLREGLFSEVNADFVSKLCQSEHLPKDKAEMVAETAGYVLMGFLHPEDLAGELVASLTLDSRLAKSIAEKINTRIFAPIREDIDKAYYPLSKFETAPPKFIRDISSGEATSMMTPAPKPLSTISSMIPSPAPAAPIAKISAPSDGKFAPVAKLSPLPQTGWSKMTTTEPPKFAPGTPIIPKPAAAPAPMPASPTTPSGPKPIILHEDAAFKSTDKTADFHLSKPGQGAEVSLEGVKSQQAVKSAVLELGTLGKVDQKPTGTSPKLTHYTEFSAQLTPVGTANTTGRDVTEITAKPISVSPAAPTTAMPAQTPVAQTTPPKTAAPAPFTPTTLSTPKASPQPTQTRIPSPSEGKFAPSLTSPYAPAAPKPQPQPPQSQQSRAPQPPQPPKPPQPPAPPEAKVIQRNYP